MVYEIENIAIEIKTDTFKKCKELTAIASKKCYDSKLKTKCFSCAKDALLGKRRCQTCLDKAKYISKRFRNNKAINICISCSNEVTDEYKVCSICREKRNKQIKIRNDNKSKELCCRCNNIAEKESKYCSLCKEKRSLYIKRYSKMNPDKITIWGRNVILKNKEKYIKRYKEHYINNKEMYYIKSIKYKTLKYKAFVLEVDRIEIFKRDNYICQLCGKLTDKTVGYRHSLYPTIDHIIPLSKGGTHEPDNVQTAHKGCNSSKGNRNAIAINYVPTSFT